MATEQKIDKFLSSLTIDAPLHHQTISELRDATHKISSEAEERFMYGGILAYYKGVVVCGYFARKNHISLEFAEGAELTDKWDALEGSGKKRRHIKLQPGESLAKNHVGSYLKQAFKNARSAK